MRRTGPVDHAVGMSMRAMTPQTLDWIARAPLVAEVSRTIPAPTPKVWAAIADHASWPTWATRLEEVVPGPEAAAVGGTRTVDIGLARVDEEFLAWEPEERFAFTLVSSSRGGLRSMVEDVRLLPSGDQACVVTYTQALDLPGARLLAPVLRPVLKRVIGEMLDGLADHVS